MKTTRKTLTMTVQVSVPSFMTAAQARREVRTLINNQSNYLSGITDRSGNWRDVDDKTVRAKSVSPAFRKED